ncbi:acetyl-CoA carboxylase carboxyltransferase subunit alpha [candidate division WOR-3 bacterium RBG_13_43_14]|uniref:Acetyl-coenzyme A carboxylase carboxyl transferase subunit alpha n=1 Tax=candidate division WOR-3 bacterium RBG_13_43_14 TaxID=1802590 RepID=A0A1F4UAM6_UNCW3|nr:MAG: acetyl-CoA carboxylase carboxyltransferase subunit alpha [candidate division WOR-3 bacterium RBG_13_43_14]
MNGIWLDFERPIIELEKKIEELKGLRGVDDEIERLKAQVDRLKKKIYSNLSRWQRAQLARHPRRPYPLDIINRITNEFVELHGDRRFRDDAAIVAGIAKFDTYSVAIVAHQKGRDTKDRMKRNFGMPHPEGYRKALRIMKMAARFKMPILTFIDTQGAYPGVGAEERGQAEAIAVNLFECSVLPTPIIVVIVGEGGSGGALALAVGDRILMLENAFYSVISPEGCASILWRDSSKNKDAAEALRMTAQDLKGNGIIDKIIPEPLGGAHFDFDQTARNITDYLKTDLEELVEIPTDELIASRIQKFRRMGVYRE